MKAIDIDWQADFAAHPAETDRLRAIRLGVCTITVFRARRRLGIKAVSLGGRPRKPGVALPLWSFRLEVGERNQLDALARVLGCDREGALRRLIRSARSTLPGGGRDARAKFDAALADLQR